MFRSKLVAEACLKRAHRKGSVSQDRRHARCATDRVWRAKLAARVRLESHTPAKISPSCFRRAEIESNCRRGKAARRRQSAVENPLILAPRDTTRNSCNSKECVTLGAVAVKCSFATKSTDTIKRNKKQFETNHPYQARTSTDLHRALDRESAIVTVIVK
jgi:hypothetical protein